MPAHPGVEPEWLDDQISKYKAAQPRYEQYAEALKAVLEKAAAKLVPLAIVQARPKTIESFGEKAIRDWPEHPDPVEEFTDLCAARVITPTRRGVELMCRFIEDQFEIDRENSVPIEQRLQPTEFGYRSVHYIVSPRAGSRLADKFDGLKAEVQVRTVLEHGYSDFTHDRSYKGAFKVPAQWERRLCAIAAMIEVADGEFIDIDEGLRTYAATYGQYLTRHQLRHEVGLFERILDHDKKNADLAARIGKLAIAAEDWRKAIEVLTPYSKGRKPNPSVLRDLGVAMCKLHKRGARDKRSDRHKEDKAAYRRGQRHLERATKLAPTDVDAMCSLAGTWKGLDEEKVASLYQQAFQIDPTDPFALCNHLECQITRAGGVSLVRCLGPIIRQSIDRCREQAAVGMNMPWAHYSRGLFHLLLGDPYRSLAAYAKAIETSSASFMISTSLATLDRLASVSDQLRGYEWMRRLLMLGLVARFPSSTDAGDARPRLQPTPGANPITAPVTILAGGCDASIEQKMKDRYQSLLVEAFRGFEGTLIGGGTTAGISGIASAIQQQYPDSITTIGYVPEPTPEGATIDSRYRQLRRTEGETFTPLEPLQNWSDLIASGILPYDVRVLAVNGGEITAAECRIALALGASVALVEESGREAAKLLTDPEWERSPRLVRLPPEAAQVNAFVLRGAPMLPAEIRDTVAKAVHNLYRRNQAGRKSPDDPAMAEWESLREDLRESNRQQADHFLELLRRIDCRVERVSGRAIGLMGFTAGEIEVMAELEHERWNRERLRAGWRYGPERDTERKISPYLVPWSELPDEIKEYDRETARGIPQLLAEVGIEITRTA
jgi:ppGpp synthetase/RelA/SpoT-type nucleotidyltranferase